MRPDLHHLASERKMEFNCCALETYGQWGTQAIQLCNKIANFTIHNDETWTYDEVKAGLFSAVAIALQKGNAFACFHPLSRPHIVARAPTSQVRQKSLDDLIRALPG